MMHRRRLITLGLGAAAGVLWPAPTKAQSGGGTIRIIFPFAPGGPGDAVSRLIGEAISAALGRPVIVDNRTGADGRIGIQAVKNAAPSGDTLLATTGPTMWLMHMVHTAPGFDPFSDFTPVARLANYDFCVAAANTTGIKSIGDLIAWAKANPAKASYGIPGAGTIPHFIGVQLAKLMAVDMARVAYRGGVPAINDLINGQIPIGIGTSADALQQHRAGNLRMLATTGAERSPFTPEVPTLRESGIDLVGEAFYGLWAPAGTGAELVARLNGAVNSLLSAPAARDRLGLLGLVPAGGSPEALTAAVRSAVAQWAPIVKATGYSIDQ